MEPTKRYSYVLVVGQSHREWESGRSLLKSALQGQHMGWSCPSDAVPTGGEAVDIIARREDLEVVCFVNRTVFSEDGLLREAEMVAKFLARHKYKPWVMLDTELEFLKPVFDTAGIRVESGSITDVVFARWRSQVKRAVVAA